MSLEDTLRISDRLTTLERRTAEPSAADRELLDHFSRRAVAVGERHGIEAPRPMPGESATGFAGRTLNAFRDHTPELASLDFTKIDDRAALRAFGSQIFTAAEQAAPRAGADGSVRYVEDRSSGRLIIRPAAKNDDAVWRQFTNVSFMVGRFLRPNARHVPQPDFAPRAPQR